MLSDLKVTAGIRCEYCQSYDNDFIGYRRHSLTFSISKKDTYCIYKCKECSLYFVFPRPAAEELKRFFEEEYHSVRYGMPLYQVAGKYPSSGIVTAATMRIRRFFLKLLLTISHQRDVLIEDVVRRHIFRLKRKPTILEIGLGTAPLIYL